MADPITLIDTNQKIKIQPGIIFTNRTYKYLSPAMKLYGEEFIIKLRLLYGLAIGIQDFGLNITPEERKIENNIYYVFDVNGQYTYGKHVDIEKCRIDFYKVLSWLREQDYFVKDYPFDSGRKGSQHVIALKLPKENLMTLFLDGKYSQMYTKDELNKIVNKTVKVLREEIPNPIYSVLSGSEEFRLNYLDILNKTFNSKLSLDDIKHHTEYDIPPFVKNEILRW